MLRSYKVSKYSPILYTYCKYRHFSRKKEVFTLGMNYGSNFRFSVLNSKRHAHLYLLIIALRYIRKLYIDYSCGIHYALVGINFVCIVMCKWSTYELLKRIASKCSGISKRKCLYECPYFSIWALIYDVIITSVWCGFLGNDNHLQGVKRM